LPPDVQDDDFRQSRSQAGRVDQWTQPPPPMHAR
jgi:hypothetical protein